MALVGTVSRTYSGRSGPTARARDAGVCISAMGDNLLLDAIGKQHLVKALGERAGGCGTDGIAAAAVELGLALAGLGREQQRAFADHHRLWNGVGHEQYRELR